MIDRSQDAARKVLRALQSVLSQVAEPSAVLKTILAQAVRSTDADRGVFVEVLDPARVELKYRVLYRFDDDELIGEAGRFSRGIFEQVLATGQPARLHDASAHPDFMNLQSIRDFRMASVLCAPIRVADRIAALLHLENDRPGHFTEAHETVMASLLEIAGPALGTLSAGEGMLRENVDLRNRATQAQGELQENRRFLSQNWSFGRFVGRSAAVRELEDVVRKASCTDFPVLLLGETGTGKSLLARVLHHASPRAERSMVTVSCPNLEKGMVESELFGHRRGAFTGAVADRIGKVQAAEGGTLFLDEIGELPIEIQPKLLRLLEERTFERVGDPSECRVDVRVVAATNCDLEDEVRNGRFRRDLYERMNYVPIRVPPLRERRDDIPVLLQHCLDQLDAGRWVRISDEALDYLRELDFAWPGNVRNLKHLAARLAMDAPDGAVNVEMLRRQLDAAVAAAHGQPDGPATAEDVSLELGLPTILARVERRWIETALQRYPNLSRAELAEKLQIAESTLYKKLKLYGITR